MTFKTGKRLMPAMVLAGIAAVLFLSATLSADTGSASQETPTAKDADVQGVLALSLAFPGRVDVFMVGAGFSQATFSQRANCVGDGRAKWHFLSSLSA